MYPEHRKSPLRYLGGKSKAIKKIIPYFPKTDEILSPFLGGGGIELYMANMMGIRVYGYDNFQPLTNFWNHFKSVPGEVIEGMRQWMPLRGNFHYLRKIYFDIEDPLQQAIAFWALNKSSFSGLTLASTGIMGKQKEYTMDHFVKFRDFKAPNLTVKQAGFQESLNAHPDMFAYLDPPYIGRERGYGDGKVKTFPHKELSEMVKERNGRGIPTIVSYNNSQEVRDLYKGFRFAFPQWKYAVHTADGQKDSNEILILSRDIKWI